MKYRTHCAALRRLVVLSKHFRRCAELAFPAQVAEAHARLHNSDAGGYMVEDLASPSGTFLNGRRLSPRQPTQLCPGDELCFGCKETEAVRYKIKMVHASVCEQLSQNGSNGLQNGKKTDPEPELVAA